MAVWREYLHKNDYHPKHYKQATKLLKKPLIHKIIIGQDNLWGIPSALKFQSPDSSRLYAMSLYTGPRDMAQPTRWASTIKRLPHCSTQYHFTGFTFPKLRFQLFPILKHSCLVLSPRWSNLPQNRFTFQRKKKKKVADLHYLECQGHTPHQ